LNFQISQDSVAANLRQGGRFHYAFFCIYLRMQHWRNY